MKKILFIVIAVLLIFMAWMYEMPVSITKVTKPNQKVLDLLDSNGDSKSKVIGVYLSYTNVYICLDKSVLEDSKKNTYMTNVKASIKKDGTIKVKFYGNEKDPKDYNGQFFFEIDYPKERDPSIVELFAKGKEITINYNILGFSNAPKETYYINEEGNYINEEGNIVIIRY